MSNPTPPRFEDHKGLIHMQAKFGLRWATGSGLALDYEDMFQEASLAFLLAAQGFNPEAGVKFSAYYTKVAFSQFRQTIGVMTGVKNLNATQRAEIADRKQENRKRAAAAQEQLPDRNYGVRPAYLSHMALPDDDPFLESIASDAKTPEELLEFKQNLQQAMSKLSPLAHLVVTWLRDPPPELLKELEAQMAHAEQTTGKGTRLYGYRDGLCLNSIAKFLKLAGGQFSRGELALVEHELMNMVKELEAA